MKISKELQDKVLKITTLAMELNNNTQCDSSTVIVTYYHPSVLLTVELVSCLNPTDKNKKFYVWLPKDEANSQLDDIINLLEGMVNENA